MKKIIPILMVILIVCIISSCSKVDNSSLSDMDYLIEVGTWQNDISYEVKYTFDKDNKGIYQIDKKNSANFNWEIKDNTIIIAIDESKNVYEYSLDKEEKILKLVEENGNTHTFKKDGTFKVKKLSNNKNNSIKGIYTSDDKVLVLQDNESGYGFMEDGKTIISSYIDWDTDGKTLHIVTYSGISEEATYELKKDKLYLKYSSGNEVTYKRVK